MVVTALRMNAVAASEIAANKRVVRVMSFSLEARKLS